MVAFFYTLLSILLFIISLASFRWILYSHNNYHVLITTLAIVTRLTTCYSCMLIAHAMKTFRVRKYTLFLFLLANLILNFPITIFLAGSLIKYVFLWKEPTIAISKMIIQFHTIFSIPIFTLYTILLYWVFISGVFNSTLPPKLRTNKVTFKQRIIRFLYTPTLTTILSTTILGISKIDTSNFIIITAIFGFVLSLCSPEIQLRVFSQVKHLDRYKITDKAKNSLALLRVLLTEIYISLSISVYFFGPEKNTNRIVFFSFVSCITIIITVGFQSWLKKPINGLIGTWIETPPIHGQFMDQSKKIKTKRIRRGINQKTGL